MMRRPLAYGGAAAALLLLLASPFLSLRFGVADDRVLPPDAAPRQTQDIIRQGFPAEETDAVQIVSAGAAGGDVTRYAAALSQVPGVAQVDSAAGIFAGGQRLMLGVTFAVLLAMTRSVLLPVKATLLNVLSLGVMFGALVWVFQEGNLSGVLGFTPTGSLDPSIPILMLCVAYGLSMDYEVFLLSRIKEEYDRTGDTERAVASGLQGGVPLITAAGGILALTFAAYATASVSFVQMLGVGMAVVVLVDATLIRAVLVPSLMRLAGPLNWGPLNWWPRGRATTSPR
ncbi:MMPL family transporter [Nonomuraea harbinensis]|uniref:MMPL family transporter n=2 Tax=Nonomuraea harbinensis TaxID=1286938 RepID=A0ABW1BSU1_9ACTN